MVAQTLAGDAEQTVRESEDDHRLRSVITGQPCDPWAIVRELVQSTEELNELYRSLGYSASLHDKTRKLVTQLDELTETDPFDRVSFRRTLDTLRNEFDDKWIPQPNEVKEGLREAVASVRNALDAHEPFDLPLSHLRGTIERYVQNVGDNAADARKHQVDEVLWGPVYVRHAHEPTEEYFVEGVRESVTTYLRCPWMHRPWITGFLVNHICKGQLAQIEPRPLSIGAADFVMTVPWILFGVGVLLQWLLPRVGISWLAGIGSFMLWAGFLWLLAVAVAEFLHGRRRDRAASLRIHLDPVMAGAFDGQETARRLRDLERTGIFVDSLLFPLLELHSWDSSAKANDFDHS